MKPDWMLWAFVALFAGTATGWLTDYYDKVKILSHTNTEHAQLVERVGRLEVRLDEARRSRDECRMNLSCDLATLAEYLESFGAEIPPLVSEVVCAKESRNAAQEGQ